MRYIFLLLCITTGFANSFAQTKSLSGDAEISVLTIGPGEYLYDKFGHSAIRVQDKVTNLDIVFNYGTYDFNTPNFYTKFARGKLLYTLSVSNFTDFFYHYQSEDRWITEQVLNLSIAQKQDIYKLLIENAKPENREYLYDFTHDNCATKIRDILSLALGDNIEYNTELENPKSFRQLIGENINSNTWGSLGINIALGAPIDRNASKLEEQFLPYYVMEADSEAKIKTSAGEWIPLVKKTINLYEQKEEKKATGFFLTSPWVIFTIIGLGLIIISFKDIIRKKRTKLVDISIFITTGIIGVVIALLWFATDHQTTKFNYNILWAFPISLLFIRAISKETYHKRLVHYLNLLSILIVLLFFHWITGVQKYPHPILPLLIGLLIRYRYLTTYYKNTLRNNQLNS